MSFKPQRVAEIDHSAVCITFRSGRSHKSKSEAGGDGGKQSEMKKDTVNRRREERGEKVEGGGCES